MTDTAISVTGLRKSFGPKVVLDGLDLTVPEGIGLRPARPERRRQDDDGRHPVHPHPRRRRRGPQSAGTTSSPSRTRVRAAIALTGQFSAVDDLLTGAENLRLMADLLHVGRREGRRRAADLLERFDLVDAADRVPQHLLRRHAPAARPRDGAHGRPARRLPRRADHRASTRAAAGPCGTSSARSSPTASRSCSPPSTSRRPTSWPTGSASWTRGRLVAEGTADELKRLVPGGHVRLEFAGPEPLRARRARSSGVRGRRRRRSPSRCPATAASPR